MVCPVSNEVEQILREIESLDQNFSEQLLQLKSDISMDLHSHKAESKELTNEVDLRIQEIHHKLVIRLADLKTNIETMKVNLTTQIGWYVVAAIAAATGLEFVLRKD